MTAALMEKIKRTAYELYEKNGRQEGNELINWLAAEKIVAFEQMMFPETEGEEIALLEYKPMLLAKKPKPKYRRPQRASQIRQM